MKKIKYPNEIKHIIDYKPPEINWAYQKIISFSQFSIFKTCSLRWDLQYRKKNKVFDENIHNIFGTAIHETIQYYLKEMYEVSIASADKLDLLYFFENTYRELYKQKYKKNKNKHFSTPDEMREFYEDGVNILEFFKKHKTKYFSKKGYYLIGCEVPIHIEIEKNVICQGSLDVVLYHEPTNKHIIYDIKTSTKGWSDYEKKDEIKPNQIVLYKKWYSQLYNIPQDDIEVKYLILRRKLPDIEYPVGRLQEFVPSSGKIKMSKISNTFEAFINECFVKSPEIYPSPSKSNCRFCPFKNNKELCKYAYEQE
jgi:hypothetical protein